VLAVFAGLAPVGAQGSSAPTVSSSYVPQRVYDTRRAAFSDFEMMAADLSRADVVLIGSSTTTRIPIGSSWRCWRRSRSEM